MTSEQVMAWWEQAGTVIVSLAPIIEFILAIAIALWVVGQFVVIVEKILHPERFDDYGHNRIDRGGR